MVKSKIKFCTKLTSFLIHFVMYVIKLYSAVFHLAISNMAQRHVALRERHVAIHVSHVALYVRHVALLIFRQYVPL